MVSLIDAAQPLLSVFVGGQLREPFMMDEAAPCAYYRLAVRSDNYSELFKEQYTIYETYVFDRMLTLGVALFRPTIHFIPRFQQPEGDIHDC